MAQTQQNSGRQVCSVPSGRLPGSAETRRPSPRASMALTWQGACGQPGAGALVSGLLLLGRPQPEFLFTLCFSFLENVLLAQVWLACYDSIRLGERGVWITSSPCPLSPPPPPFASPFPVPSCVLLCKLFTLGVSHVEEAVRYLTACVCVFTVCFPCVSPSPGPACAAG